MKDVLIGLLLGIFSLVCAGNAVAQQTGGGVCTSTSATKSGGVWTLSCAGSCTGSNRCKSRSSSSSGKWCGCLKTDNPTNSCCNIGLGTDGNPTTFGDCPSCPLEGVCLDVCDDEEDPTDCEAGCLVPPS